MSAKEDAQVISDWLIDRGHEVRWGKVTSGVNSLNVFHLETTREGFSDLIENLIEDNPSHFRAGTGWEKIVWKELHIFNDIGTSLSYISDAPTR